MLSNRELSEKLCELACKVEEIIDKDYPPPDAQEFEEIHKGLLEVATELHKLSNEKYEVPTSWDTLKTGSQITIKKKVYRDSMGNETPF